MEGGTGTPGFFLGGGSKQQPAGIKWIKVFLPPQDERTTLILGGMLFPGVTHNAGGFFFPASIAFSGYLNFLFLVTQLPSPPRL